MIFPIVVNHSEFTRSSICIPSHQAHLERFGAAGDVSFSQEERGRKDSGGVLEVLSPRSESMRNYSGGVLEAVSPRREMPSVLSPQGEKFSILVAESRRSESGVVQEDESPRSDKPSLDREPAPPDSTKDRKAALLGSTKEGRPSTAMTKK